ncbi:MAG: Gfo/Idh/MocA family oxidoreductase [Propionibacteriaceae bacterium]|nr:Gfo/Idh/MocA family oxidoreductase [Propionibacteriaceae bacterium]
MAKMKFVIVGCGRIATLHTAGYKDNPDAQLWGVFDINANTAREFAAEHGIPHVYGSYIEVLSDPEVTAVELLTPHHLHCEQVVQALRAGKHVSVQKPMAMNLQQCDEMIQASQETGKTLKVFENFRFYPPYQFAKKLIDAGEIGEPQGIRVKMNNASLGSRALPNSGKLEGAEDGGRTGWDVNIKSWVWRLNDTLSGGGPTVFDDGYHKFSTIMYLLGDVEKVTAWIDETPVVPGIYNDCPAVVMWKHKGRKLYGVWDIMSSDKMYIRSKYYTCDERVEITGERGIIWVTRCTATLLPEVAPVVMYRDGKVTEFWDMKADWADSFEASTRDFVEALRDGRPPVLSGTQGREVLKFALAAVDSAKQHREIFLDEYEDKPLPKKRGLLSAALTRKTSK